jgi:hypothetical protein
MGKQSEAVVEGVDSKFVLVEGMSLRVESLEWKVLGMG